MKTALRILLGLVLLLVLAVGGLYGWASMKDRALLSRTIDTHRVDFPIPFPLTGADVEEVRLASAGGGDGAGEVLALEAVALERARERGEHLVQARYACTDCHGQDFGGGVMVDDPAIGTIHGPNITAGEGGRTAGFNAADWDRIVRHGVRADGRPAAMPSQDFQRMSDQELSDIVVYIRSRPTVDATVPPLKLGPLGKVLLATGQLPLSADLISDHRRDHPAVPPAAEAGVEFGAHLAGVCTGCHGADLQGGPVPGGDPSWPAAANLTPHADGLAAWSYDDFVTLMRTGRRPDGTEVLPPMALLMPYGRKMTDAELQALWAYLESVSPLPDQG